MVYDSIKAIDYLLTRPDVDGSRIATLGISMGSTMAWWVAALDPRVKVCIDICCLTDFEGSSSKQGGLMGMGFTTTCRGCSNIFHSIHQRPHRTQAPSFLGGQL